MWKREFISYSEAKEVIEDGELLRQILLSGDLRAYIEIFRCVARESFPTEQGVVSAQNRLASWKRDSKFFEEKGQRIEDKDITYTLSGWFLLDRDHVDAVVRSGKLRSFENVGSMRRFFFAKVAPAMDDASEFPSGIGDGLRFSVELDSSPELSQLWFRCDDVAGFANQSDALKVFEEKPLGSRERNNLLRVVRALAEMYKLPAKGYAESIRSQLEALDMQVPSDDTIRKVVEEARALDS